MADLTASRQGNSPVEPSFERPLTRRRDMDGVRGLAVMAIIVFDYGLPWAKGGLTGVDTFLVLSGYFTTQLLARYFELNIFSPWRFYLERLRRIVPALAALVLAVFMAGLLLLSPWESYRFGQEMVAASVFGSNYIYLIRGSFFAERSITYPLLMTWAIGVAMPFWLVLPLAAGYLRRWSRQAAFWAVVVLSVLSLLASVYAEFHEHVWNFFLPVTRAWELGAGSMLALGMPHGSDSARLGAWPAAPWQREVTGAAGLTAVIAAMIFYRPEMRFPGYAALLPVLGAVLLLASEGSTVNRLLAVKPLALLGLFSWSLYLWHWPLLSFAEICSARPLGARTLALLFVLSFAFAAASYRFFEAPFRQVAGCNVSAGLLRFAAPLVLLAGLGLMLFVTKGLPARSPTLYGIENRAALYRHFPCISGGPSPRLGPQCAPPEQPSVPSMVVLGGGHAEAFADGLHEFLNHHGWQMLTLTRESCPPLLGVSQWSPRDSTLRNSCREFNQAALAYVLSRSDIRAVMLVGRWRNPLVADSYTGNPDAQSGGQNADDLRLGLEREISQLEAAGKHVLILEDTPEFPIDPLAGIRSRYLPFRRLANRLTLAESPRLGDGSSVERSIAVSPEEQAANAQVEAAVHDLPGTILVDPKQVFCDASRCRFASAADVYFADDIHLSRTGAMQILPLLPDLRKLNQ